MAREEIQCGNYIDIILKAGHAHLLRARALCDTGAKVDCIALEFVEKHRLQMKKPPDNLVIGTANKTTNPFYIHGVVEVNVTVADLTFPVQFYVLDNLRHTVILGEPFLIQSHAVIDLARRVVTFCDDLSAAPIIRIEPAIATAINRIVIPAESELLVNIAVPKRYDKKLIQINAVPTLQHKNLLVANSIAIAVNSMVPCNFLNVTSAPIVIYRKTPIAVATVIDDSYALHEYQPKRELYLNSISTELEYQQQLDTLVKLGVKLNFDKWTFEQRRDIVQLLFRNRDLFATSLKDLKGTTLLEFELDAQNHPPIRRRPFRMSEQARQESERQIKEMREANIIQESTSPWGFPMIVVAKKTTGPNCEPEWRCVIDFRALNKVTKPQAYPLPTQAQIFDALAAKRPSIFSLLDLKSGYLQVPVKEGPSQDLLTFVTPTGSWKYRVMPFGVSQAPALFQRLMNLCLQGYLFERVLVFLDDILVFSSCFDQHLMHLNSVFERLRAADLKLHPRKCEFGLDKLTYLGNVVSGDGIAPDPKKIEVVRTWPEPTKLKELRSFLGFAGFYRRYVKDFAKIAAEFGDLLQKDSTWKWTENHTIAFNKLKAALCQSALLPHADMSKPFRVTTDASEKAIAYILSQQDDKGFWKPVLFAGRSLKTAERRYRVMELELLALVSAIREFRHYLAGNHFDVETDHYSLKYLESLKPQTGKLARWAMELSTYNFTVIHRPGKTLGNADGLSRRPYNEIDNTPVTNFVDNDCNFVWALDKIRPDIHEAEPKHQVLNPNACEFKPANQGDFLGINTINTATNEIGLSDDKVVYEFELDDNNRQETEATEIAPILLEETESCPTHMTQDELTIEKHEIGRLQRKCEDCCVYIDYITNNTLPSDDKQARKVVMQAESMAIVDGVLYRLHSPRKKKQNQFESHVRQLVVPKVKRQEVMRAFHHECCHIGLEKGYESMRRSFWWEGAYNDMLVMVRECITCQQTKRKYDRPPPLQSLESYPVLSSWHIDHL